MPPTSSCCLTLQARARKAGDLTLKPQRETRLLQPASAPGPGTSPGQRPPSAAAAPLPRQATKRKSTAPSRSDAAKRAPRLPPAEPRKRKQPPAKPGARLSTYDTPGASGIAASPQGPKRARLDETAPSDERGKREPKASALTSPPALGTSTPPAGHAAERTTPPEPTRPSTPPATHPPSSAPKTPQASGFPNDPSVSETPESARLGARSTAVRAKPARSPSPPRAASCFSSQDEVDADSGPPCSRPLPQGAAQPESSALRRYPEPRDDPPPWYGHPCMAPPWLCWDPWAIYGQQFPRPRNSQREQPCPPSFPAPQPPHEEEEERLKQEAAPAPGGPAAKTVAPPPPPADEFQQRQGLFRRIAESLKLPVEGPSRSRRSVVDILLPFARTKTGLPVHEALLEPAKALWQTPATVAPTCKRADKYYLAPSKDTGFLSSSPTPNSMVVFAVDERERLRLTSLSDRDWKRLDLLGRRAYSAAALQFRIANYEALLSRYDHTNYSKLNDFVQYIPEESRKQFQALVSEGQLLARTALQASLDAADTAARSVATAVVVRRVAWLRPSGLPKYIQAKVEDFPFEGSNLFSNQTDDYFHYLRDGRATLRALGIGAPPRRRRQSRYRARPRSRASSSVPPEQHSDSDATEASQM